jgi:hypothetical protein
LDPDGSRLLNADQDRSEVSDAFARKRFAVEAARMSVLQITHQRNL